MYASDRVGWQILWKDVSPRTPKHHFKYTEIFCTLSICFVVCETKTSLTLESISPCGNDPKGQPIKLLGDVN